MIFSTDRLVIFSPLRKSGIKKKEKEKEDKIKVRRETVGLRNTAGIKEGASRATRETPPHLWLLLPFEDRGSRRCGDSTERWTFARKKERTREKKSHSDKVCVVAAGFSVSI